METIIRNTDLGIGTNQMDPGLTLSQNLICNYNPATLKDQRKHPLQNTSRIFSAECGVEECCSDPHLSVIDGFNVCTACGMVFEHALDQTPRRAFNQDEINRRKSNEPVYRPIGPRTVIKGALDAKGMVLPAGTRTQYNRLSKINRSLINSYERNLWIALPKLQRLQQCLNLSDILSNESFRIYSQAVKQRLTMGRSIETLLTASIFAALRIHGMARTIDELCLLVDLPRRAVLKTYQRLLRFTLPNLKSRVLRIGPEEYVDKVCSELGLPMNLRSAAKGYLKSARCHRVIFDGKDPKGLGAAVIYLACKRLKLGLTQNQIATQAHVTEMTLRTRMKDILPYIQ